ncbi:FAD-dependent monooxygenase [Nocardioides jishulii]|uniref:Aromatic ring hydroxylase n=1 Tax=Nocardioides jishulii TaxID=2575440 RepID=A0A4U2YJJ6_9ACTN|nr:FAD-dependent monooxygenase [Nocardioides jishulii]QCX26814.1 aromatic ring hydroxylase [Nocardioides jishulii]TKI61298.1 aromatic ring hydroxylase [Nocardioides jishulii]
MTTYAPLPDSPYFQPTEHPATPLEGLTSSTLPVVVAGAGPVGMAVALGLAQRGIEVVVLEAATKVSFGSRAICISRHSLEVADRLGFGEAITDLALEWEGGRSFYRDREVMRFAMPNEAHTVRGPMVNVSQSEFEQVMVEAIVANPRIQLCWGAAVAGVTQLGDGTVEVQVTSSTGDTTLRTQWLVAADGGRSAVRDALGLRLQGQSYEGRYVIADIHWQSDLPAERMVWFDPPSNPGSTVIMHQQPHDIWRIDYQLAPDDDAEEETREERIRERIAAHLAWLGDERPWRLEWHGFYKARALALDSFLHDRVVFTGDAAHLVPIFGVRGLNSGMEDAETLVWMLASVIHGTADAALLATYSHERHDAWEQNIANAGKSTLVMTPGSYGHRTTRDAVLALATERGEFSHLINPRQSSATHARTSPLTVPLVAPASGLQPGDPVQDRRVRLRDGKQSSLNDVRSTGFGLYGFGLDAESLAAARELRTALSVQREWEYVTLVLDSAPTTLGAATTAEVVLDDAAAEVAHAWGARPGELFVVRPDGLLLARGQATDLHPVLDALATGQTAHLSTAEPSTADRAGATVVAEAACEQAPEQDPAEAAREAIWLALSDGLNSVAADDRDGFLTRLALLLGNSVGESGFAEAVAVAHSVR